MATRAKKKNGAGELAIEYVAPDTLKPDPDNPRTMGAPERERLTRSIRTFGLVDPIIARRGDRLIVGGHQRAEVARVLGLERVPVVFLEGLSDHKTRLLNIALNNDEAQGAWDPDKLSAIVRRLNKAKEPLGPSGFSDITLKDLLRFDAREDKNGAGDGEPNDAEYEPPAKPKSKKGEVYQLGPHLLVCGDCTKEEVLRKVVPKGKPVDCVFMDPPYAIFGSSTGVSSDVADKILAPLIEAAWRQVSRALKMQRHVYACCDWRSWATYWNAAKGTGIVPKNMIVWEKNGSGVGTNYANTHELLFFGILAGVQVQMRDALKGSYREVLKPNVMHMSRVASAGHKDGRLHNAQKPVLLVRTALENSTDKRDVVLDLFAGAGTTAIAAEECGRVARLIELEPKWCDVIRRRYADLVGDKKLAP